MLGKDSAGEVVSWVGPYPNWDASGYQGSNAPITDVVMLIRRPI